MSMALISGRLRARIASMKRLLRMALLLTVGIATGVAEPPAHDAFDQPLDLGSALFGSMVLDLAEATLDENEFSDYHRTLWYRWRAPDDGYLTISRFLQGSSELFRARTERQLEKLTSVEWVRSAGLHAFEVAGGQDYRLRFASDEGRHAASFRFWQRGGGSESFSEAPAVTLGIGEHWAHVASNWIEWTPPLSGVLDIPSSGPGGSPATIYLGDSDTPTTLVASSSPRLWPVDGNQTYRIHRSDSVFSQWSYFPEMTNGTFGQSIELGSVPSAELVHHDAYAVTDAALEDRADILLSGSNRPLQLWHWIAPGDGWATLSPAEGHWNDLETPGSPWLLAYRGDTIDDLQPHGSLDGGPIGFPTAAGESYHLAISSTRKRGGIVALTWTADGDNDYFALATDLGNEDEVAWSGTMSHATVEAGESDIGDSLAGTRWWRWTAPAEGEVVFTPLSWSGYGNIEMFGGKEINALVRVDEQSFVAPEEIRRIRVSSSMRDGWIHTSRPVDFHLKFWTTPANDNFADAENLGSSILFDQEIYFYGAGSEPGEPHAGRTLWYRWTAPADGRLVIPRHSRAYAGTNFTNLTELEDRLLVNERDQLMIQAKGENGPHTMTLRFEEAPENNRFENAIDITDASKVYPVVMTAATNEIDEPSHHLKQSVWFRWIAPGDGAYHIKFPDERVSVKVDVYSGNSLATLRHESLLENSSSQLFEALAGQTYSIAVHTNALTWWPQDEVVAFSIAKGEGLVSNGTFATATDWGSRWFASETFSFAGAGIEEGEPLAHSSDRTVWWKWTPARTFSLRVASFIESSILEMDLFAGDQLDSLVHLGTHKRGLFSDFVVSGDNTYYLRAKLRSSFLSPLDLFSVTIEATASPHGTFATALDLGSLWHDSGYIRFNGSSLEDGEPLPPGDPPRGSVWRKWQAPEDGVLHLEVKRATTVFRGDRLEALERLVDIPWNGVAEVAVEKGRPYAIASYTFRETLVESDWVTLCFEPVARARNDAFRDRIALTEIPYVWIGDAGQPTMEPDEPNAAEGEGSLWWSLETTLSERLYLSADRDGVPLAVYEGEALEDLIQIPLLETAPGSRVWEFDAEAGQTYHIQRIGDANADTFSLAVVRDVYQNTTPETAALLADPGVVAPFFALPWETYYWDWVADEDGLLTASSVADNRLILLGSRQDEEARNLFTEAVPFATGTQTLLSASHPDGARVNLDVDFERLIAPPNDRREDAADLGERTFVHLSASGFGATLDDGERPLLSEAGSRWWRWTSPFNGYLIVEPPYLDQPAQLDIYEYDLEADPPKRLGVVNRTRAIIEVSAKQVLWIRLQTSRWDRSFVPLRFVAEPLNLHDTFEKRLRAEVTNFPVHFPVMTTGPEQSYWLTFRAPANQMITLSVNNDAHLTVFESKIGNEVKENVGEGFRTVSLRLIEGRHYTVAVQSPPETQGGASFDLTLKEIDLSHRTFEDAIHLTGDPAQLAVYHDLLPPDVSDFAPSFPERADTEIRTDELPPLLWYRWTAPRDGVVSVYSSDRFFIGMGSGETRETFAPFQGRFFNPDDLEFHRNPRWEAKVGATYRIAIAPESGDAAPAQLSMVFAQSRQPPQPNDAFSNATPLEAEGSWTVRFAETSSEPFEGNVYPFTAWWKWEAEPNSEDYILLSSQTEHAVLQAYHGSDPSKLTLLTSETFTTAFPADEDAYIRFASGKPWEQVLTARRVVDATHRQGVAEAIELGLAEAFRISGVDSDTYPLNRHDLYWWRWTAPRDGVLAVREVSSFNFEPVAFFEDQDGAPYRRISDETSWIARSGMTYWLGVQGRPIDDEAIRGFVHDLVLIDPAENDFFANAIDLGSLAELSVRGHTVWASRESGEPRHGDFADRFTVWYRWTAPFGGTTTFSLQSDHSSNRIHVNAYTGSTLDRLVPFDGMAKEGETLFIAVAGRDSNQFDLQIRLQPDVLPSMGFEDWIAVHFPENPEWQAPDLDPDGDRHANLVEYLLDGDPGTFDASLIEIDDLGSHMAIRYRRRVDTRLLDALEASPDLLLWSEIDPGVRSRGDVGDQGDLQLVQWLIPRDESERWFQLRATLSEKP